MSLGRLAILPAAEKRPDPDGPGTNLDPKSFSLALVYRNSSLCSALAFFHATSPIIRQPVAHRKSRMENDRPCLRRRSLPGAFPRRFLLLSLIRSR